MTTTPGQTPPATSTPARQPFLLCAVVALGILIGWLAYHHWGYPRLQERAFRWQFLATHFWLVNLSTAALIYLPYALALLVWGRTAGRRVVGALVAAAAGGYLWAVYEVFSTYVWNNGPVDSSSATAYSWANLLVLPTLVALAWGIARRWGRAWLAGLVVAPALASVIHELGLHSRWWRLHVADNEHSYHWLIQDLIFLAPAVTTAVVCALVDAAAFRHTPETPKAG